MVLMWIAFTVVVAIALFLWSHVRFLNRRLINFATYTGAILLAPQMRDRQEAVFRDLIRAAEGDAGVVGSQVLLALGFIADGIAATPGSTLLLDVNTMIWREKQTLRG